MSGIIQGRARILPAEINTDVHCSAKYMPGKNTEYVAQHAFEQIDAGFVGRFEKGDIIVAGKNFGINSSREQAIQVMRVLGVSAVVSPAFGRQFFRNAINNGLALMECDISAIREGDELSIDLTAGTLKAAGRDGGCTFAPLPREIQSLLAAGGLIPFLKEHPDWKIA
ncbi:MAG TPA: 3-isopropylmalate dehydratase [Burkholderiales bacterium]|nr:3-isopropylmalate dehydratase [Burkholderiales bacterium]